MFPSTKTTNKQLLPVYDKPLIYYPLSTLMLAGIKEVLLICTALYKAAFQQLLGDGSHLGIKIEYRVQEIPNGLPEAFIIGESFLNGDDVMLVLGDNLFFGNGFQSKLQKLVNDPSKGATIFCQSVNAPERFGIVELDSLGAPISFEEKPNFPKSNLAITGLYCFSNECVRFAHDCIPSDRGELEILDIIKAYHGSSDLNVEVLGRGYAWFDAGTPESLLEASNFVCAVETRQNLQIACLEEIAFSNGWIDEVELMSAANNAKGSRYGKYIMDLAQRI